jgi:GntR family transcriptional regulator, arabinose operon transcriptional repressor
MGNQDFLFRIKEGIDHNSSIPKYLQIINFIKKMIDTNEIQAGAMLPSESLFCHVLNVSRSPVRNALGELVDEGYLKRIQGKGTFVRESKYHSVHRSCEKVIGFVTPDMKTTFAIKVVVGIEGVLSRKGYSLLFGISNHDDQQERDIVNRFLNLGIDGLILLPSNKTSRLNEEIQQLDPAVTQLLIVDRRLSGGDFNYIGNDNHSGAYTCARHFQVRGYKNIAFCGVNLHVSAVAERLSGFVQGANNNGLHLINQYFNGQSDMSESEDCYLPETFLEKINILKENAPVGILAENDEVAINLQKQLENAGLRIGVDYGLIGFINSEEGKQNQPPLTSVSQNSLLLGQTAAEMIVNSINDKSTNKTIHILPTQLIIRKSCELIINNSTDNHYFNEVRNDNAGT